MVYTQDIFGSANSMYILIALINSVGLSTVFIAIALRKSYKSAPAETVFAASIAGLLLKTAKMKHLFKERLLSSLHRVTEPRKKTFF